MPDNYRENDDVNPDDSRVDYPTPVRYHDSVRTLYYGDNLDILRKYLQGETVDLIYLDPPFNSQRGRDQSRPSSAIWSGTRSSQPRPESETHRS